MGKYEVEVTEVTVGNVVVEAESHYYAFDLMRRAMNKFGRECLSNVRSRGYAIKSVKRIRDNEADATLTLEDFD